MPWLLANFPMQVIHNCFTGLHFRQKWCVFEILQTLTLVENSMQSSYVTFSNGLNVTGNEKPLPGLSIRGCGYIVVKTREFGVLHQQP